MGQMVGADVAELEQLAVALDRGASQLVATSSTVRNGIQISAWIGPVARRFRVAWASQHSKILTQAARELRDAAQHVREQAEEQRVASSAGGAGSARHHGTHSRSSGAVASGRLDDRALVDFAQSAYRGKGAPPGWRDLSDEEMAKLLPGVSLHDDATGFDARVLTDGDGHYVISYGGTDPGVNPFDGLSSDERHDIAGAVWSSSQTDQAMQLALSVKASVGDENMVITGHSLGGRNAAMAAVASDIRAVTFDAAGLSDPDLMVARNVREQRPASYLETTAALLNAGTGGRLPSVMAAERLAAREHITNYAIWHSPLIALQVGTGLPDAVGTQVSVDDPQGALGFDAHGLDAIKRGMD